MTAVGSCHTDCDPPTILVATVSLWMSTAAAIPNCKTH